MVCAPEFFAKPMANRASSIDSQYFPCVLPHLTGFNRCDSMIGFNVKASDAGLIMLGMVLETLIDAVMIVNADGEILQLNTKAKQLCQHLVDMEPSMINAAKCFIPKLIQPVFAALLEGWSVHPQQQILPEFEIQAADGMVLRMRGQFMDIPRSNSDMPYVLITIENRQESLRSVAIGDAQRFGLTDRETEVWHLRLLGYSYRDIAQQLYITENTVRKHVKSVLAKRRVILEEIPPELV